MVTLLNHIINPNDIVEQLYDSYLQSKNTKIVRYLKITLIICKLQEIHINLLEYHDLLSILEKNYIGLLFEKFPHKSWVIIL